jgi:hypothetical protein
LPGQKKSLVGISEAYAYSPTPCPVPPIALEPTNRIKRCSTPSLRDVVNWQRAAAASQLQTIINGKPISSTPAGGILPKGATTAVHDGLIRGRHRRAPWPARQIHSSTEQDARAHVSTQLGARWHFATPLGASEPCLPSASRSGDFEAVATPEAAVGEPSVLNKPANHQVH